MATILSGTQIQTAALQVDSAPISAASIAAAVDARALGVGQTWQNVAADRAVATIYQNTTGKPIQVAIAARRGSSGPGLEVSIDGETFFTVSETSGTGNSVHNAVIPDQTYYRMATGNTIDNWSELR